MKFDPRDVVLSSGHGSVSGSGSFDRRTQERTEWVEMLHRPTGLVARREHGPAYLTKSRWKQVRAEMMESATAELKAKVEKTKASDAVQ